MKVRVVCHGISLTEEMEGNTSYIIYFVISKTTGSRERDVISFVSWYNSSCFLFPVLSVEFENHVNSGRLMFVNYKCTICISTELNNKHKSG